MDALAPTWRIKDQLMRPRFPTVMGILNATPDSFHAGSRVTLETALAKAGKMLEEGATILDVGGASSRPGSGEVPVNEELSRVLPVIEAVHHRFPDVLISIDTWRSTVAREAVAQGASIVNDIGAGLLDTDMLATVAQLGVPYIAMHMQGTPKTMQADPRYDDVVGEVTHFLSERIAAAHDAGIADVIIDPGFGFGKTTEHNYALLRALPRLAVLATPVLVGLSRKRMINDVLSTRPEEALNGTSALNMAALMLGASILRVHDAKEAREVVDLFLALRGDR